MAGGLIARARANPVTTLGLGAIIGTVLGGLPGALIGAETGALILMGIAGLKKLVTPQPALFGGEGDAFDRILAGRFGDDGDDGGSGGSDDGGGGGGDGGGGGGGGGGGDGGGSGGDAPPTGRAKPTAPLTVRRQPKHR